MDDHILDTHSSPTAACVDPGPSVKSAHRCRCCRCKLLTTPSTAHVLANHLSEPGYVKCLDFYAAKKDLVHIFDGDGGLVIGSTLHTFRDREDRWSVEGVAPNGEMRKVATCRGKKHANETLEIFLELHTEDTK